MKIVVILFLLLNITLTGCSNVRAYTFKKDRVDQEETGNRGYIVGTPPALPARTEIPKRTLFGVDVEIPILPGEKVELPPDEGAVYKEDATLFEADVFPRPETTEEKVNIPQKPEKQAPAAAEKDVSRDKKWIK